MTSVKYMKHRATCLRCGLSLKSPWWMTKRKALIRFSKIHKGMVAVRAQGYRRDKKVKLNDCGLPIRNPKPASTRHD